jgi:hypothetical protein
MTLALEVVGALGWLLLLAGCVLLHIRVRRISSISFLLSLVSVAAWTYWGQSVLWEIFPVPPGTGTAKDLKSLGQVEPIVAAIEAALMLWVGGSFFFSVKAIRPVARSAA